MKLLFALVLFSNLASATGSIFIEPRYDSVSKQTYGNAGLSVWEKLNDKMALDVWTGAGSDLRSHGPDQNLFQNWFVSKVQVEFKLPKSLSLTPGWRLQVNPDADGVLIPKRLNEYFVRLTYRIW